LEKEGEGKEGKGQQQTHTPGLSPYIKQLKGDVKRGGGREEHLRKERRTTTIVKIKGWKEITAP